MHNKEEKGNRKMSDAPIAMRELLVALASDNNGFLSCTCPRLARLVHMIQA